MPAKRGVKYQARISRRGKRRQLIFLYTDRATAEKITEMAEKEGVSRTLITTRLFKRAWKRFTGGE
jgi:hypothetical protein